MEGKKSQSILFPNSFSCRIFIAKFLSLVAEECMCVPVWRGETLYLREF